MTEKRVSADDRLFSVEKKAFLRLCKGIDTPRALACKILAENGEWAQLLDLPFDPKNYGTAAEFRDDALVSLIMAKNPRLPLEINKRDVALQKFVDSEAACAITNRRFRTTRAGQLPDDCDDRTRKVFLRARRLIVKVLGPLTPRVANDVWARARFGPGATSDVTGRAVALSRKYSTFGATPRLRDLWKLLPRMWLEAGAYKIHAPVHYSRVTTVPKNAKTDRTICVEPHMNILVQLGIGGYIRSRLKRFGVDLSRQEFNQLLAEKAVEWGLATIDLSSASDLIAEALIHALIPRRWVHLLLMARTDFTELPDGSIVRLQKWSSMGNGYTFELETLIFWALARAACPKHSIVSAYGDDIIVPQTSAPEVIAALEYCGFRVNGSKSFLGGRFFESCGSDWFDGVNVRPVFFRAEVKNDEDVIDALLLYANQLRRWAFRSNGSSPHYGCDHRLQGAWLALRDKVPKEWQLFIPDGSGDGGLVGNFDEAVPKWDRKWMCYTYRTRVRPPREFTPRGQHALGYLLSVLHDPIRNLTTRIDSKPEWLRVLQEQESRITLSRRGRQARFTAHFFSEAMRGAVDSPREAVGPAYGWPDLGPWM